LNLGNVHSAVSFFAPYNTKPTCQCIFWRWVILRYLLETKPVRSASPSYQKIHAHCANSCDNKQRSAGH
jgi:hypothetical protein